ncbi:MAG: hypothetical protein RI580_07130 [Halothece sp. Uz-M2-17]|nr:hypothetical protein [Halothece sp. Uz-M2-17]
MRDRCVWEGEGSAIAVCVEGTEARSLLRKETRGEHDMIKKNKRYFLWKREHD